MNGLCEICGAAPGQHCSGDVVVCTACALELERETSAEAWARIRELTRDRDEARALARELLGKPCPRCGGEDWDCSSCVGAEVNRAWTQNRKLLSLMNEVESDWGWCRICGVTLRPPYSQNPRDHDPGCRWAEALKGYNDHQ